MDTLKIAEHLIAAGVGEKQAKAHAEVIADAVDASGDDLVTKADLNAAMSKLEARMAERDAASESRSTTRMIALFGFFSTLIVIAIKFF